MWSWQNILSLGIYGVVKDILKTRRMIRMYKERSLKREKEKEFIRYLEERKYIDPI